MKKSNISKVLSSVRTSMAKHSPEILTGIGIANDCHGGPGNAESTDSH